MNCLKCDSPSKVIDHRKRKWSIYKRQRRRRECIKCKHRFTTYEYYEVDELHKEIIESELKQMESILELVKNKIINYRTKKLQYRSSI